MSKTQRLTFLGIAVVIAIVAVVVLVGGEETGTSTAETTATPTATPDETATATATPTPTPAAPLLKGGKVTKLEFSEGETVKFRVVSDVPEEVHVHGYDIAKDLEPGKVATVSFPASITGIFEIEYEHAGEQIGQLRVNPK